MTTQTKRPPQSRKLVRQPVGPVDKRRRKRGLTVAVRTAIDVWVYERCTRAEACKRAGFTERALYLALEKPEVAAYYNAALVVLRAGERPKNIHRLAEIRDRADNMPAVQAIKTLEMLDSDAVARPRIDQSSWVTIRITAAPAAPALPAKVIEHEAELGRDPHDPCRELAPARFKDPTDPYR